MNEGDKTYKATEPKTLEDRIMSSLIAKSEAEWWAKREIERLRALVQQVEKAKGVLPKKRDLKDNFVYEPYCNFCEYSETLCQCTGYNQAIDECAINLVKELDVDKLKTTLEKTYYEHLGADFHPTAESNKNRQKIMKTLAQGIKSSILGK